MAEELGGSKVSIRFDALHVGEGELKLDLTLYALTERWGLIRGNGNVTRSLDPALPPMGIPQAVGMYQVLDGGTHNFHVSGEAYAEGGLSSLLNASGAVDKSWNGRGTFLYAHFDVGPCVITRDG